MKILISLSLVILAGCSMNKPHADLVFGARNFDDNTQWQQMDYQPAVGFQAHMAGQDSFGPEASFLVSHDTSLDGQYVNRRTDSATSTVREYSIGLRKNWALNDKWQFFISGGEGYSILTTVIRLSYQGDIHAQGSESLSPYVQTGINYNLGHNYSCGLMLRRDFWAEGHNVFTTEPPADSTALFFTFGYSF